ncbi:unnamed protein product [Knipowitschia caucasica]|uniref:Nucleoprotein TPR n=1 Tax=Knipowitschia caucasica TaxID=637954 RepID=A0AAV2JVL8_KNICA
MAAVLLQALERTELNKLPKGVQNKLERFVTELQHANEALQTERERLKADSEQQYFDIEKRLAETQGQFLASTRDLQTVKEENQKLNEELSTLKGIEGESADEKSSQPQQQTKTKYEIEAEKRELARLLEKRTQEVENLNEDLTRLNEKLVETNKVKMDLQLKLDELQSSESAVQHREKRMEQEKELLQQKIDWFTSELKAKTEELLETNRDKGKQVVDLQSSLQTSKEEVSRLESQLSSLKETSESQTKRAEDFNNKLKKAREEQCAMEEKYRNELNAHIKLSSLYKSTASDMEKKNNELNRAVQGLSKIIKETGEANKVLEKKVSETEEQKTRLEAELREKIKKMEKELENVSVKAAGKHCCAQSLTEEQLDAMCPSAATIAAIVKPGMKFFDLYNAYAECQTQLQLEKQETRRVNRVLDEIVQEVESKAPVFKRQKEEYEDMQRSMASLCNKLEQARAEIYSLQKEKDEAKQKCDALEQEKSSAERQLDDSSAQVCTLLAELEEARGNPVVKNESSVTTNQLSFRNIQELQQQNQNMQRKLKDLEEESNKKQTKVTSERVSELEASVDKLQKDIEQLKEQRNQQKQLADSNARQRDMYKALLTQSTGYTLPPQGPESLSLSPQVRPSVPATRSMPQRAAAAESAQTTQAKAALKQLNDSFMLYKKEKAENDRMLNETNDRLQKQRSELSSRNAKLASQLDFSNKRYEMLQENVAAYRREITALQDRCKKMSTTSQSQERALFTMSQDLRQANEKLALEEVRVQNLTKEKEMLRQAESRLNKEKEAILTEQRNQNLLLTNLKTIQLTMDRTETDFRQRLNNKIDQLESELAAMKTKLNQEVAQRHALGRSMDTQLLEAKKQLETQNTLQQKTRELLRSSEQQVAALKAQLAAAASGSDSSNISSAPTTPAGRAAALRAPLRVRSPGPPVSQQPTVSEQELSEVKGQLRTAEEQRSELQEQLKSANATVEQYRAVVLTLEDSLKKEKESRTPLEIRLKESQEVQKELEQRLVEAEKMKLQDGEERRKAVNAVEKQVIELQRILKASQTEQREALERCSLAVTQEEKAIQDSRQQTKFAEEAQAKYEKELMLHAADVEALQDLKKRFHEISAIKQELEENLSKSTALLQEKTATWSTVEKQMKENLANERRRCEELGKQNSLLHKEMDELAAKNRTQHQEPPLQNLDLSFSEEGKTTAQILEILRFVRREKEIALAQFEASEGEALRYKQRVEHQERELKELQEALNTERERMQTTAKTMAQQEQQLKKMETISALQEVNRSLKLDKDKLEHELKIFRAKVTRLQADIAPLHQNLSVLSEKNGSLQADKRILEEDLKRWKLKVQQLTNQQKDGDVEEKQRLISERDTHVKRITQLSEEGAKLKTELAKSNASNNSAQSQLQTLKDTVARATSERDNVKKELEAKNQEILEKNKTITQVKKIGRRYKTQYEELKAQHDKMVQEVAAKQGSEAGSDQEKQQLTQVQEELKKAQEELAKNKDEMQKKIEEIQKSKQQLEEAQKENQQSSGKVHEVQNRLNQNQNQLTQVQSQLSQTQTQLQQNQNQINQGQRELQLAKTQNQQLQNQLKAAQTQTQARQSQIQHIQKELQQTKENLQQTEKELQQTRQSSQQSMNQEVEKLKASLSQSESKASELQGQLENLQKTLGERDIEVKRLEEQLSEDKLTSEAASSAAQAAQATPSQSSDGNTEPGRENELNKLRQELMESRNREEQLRQQIADKEEKTKKAFLGAKTKIGQLNSVKEQLSKEVEELKQDNEEQEVRMNAIKSQYEMRLARLDRELRELRETQSESREETQDPSGTKGGGDQSRQSEQRQMSMKSPAQDRGSSSQSEPPTANIRPTPSTPSPSSKPSPTPGSKATPRASIRPMVTPSVPTPTPTATVMPTTQTDSQEVSLGGTATVHSTSSGLSNTPTTIAQPTSSHTTAFVQPTQQQAANQEPGSSMEAERPSTSSAFAPGSKRVRDDEEEEESRPESSRTSPTVKKLRRRLPRQIEEEEDDIVEELRDDAEQPDSAESEMAFTVMAEDEDIEEEDDGVSQSVPLDQSQTLVRDVIVIDTDSESRESKEMEKQQEDDAEEEEEEEEEEDEEEQEEEYKDDEDDDEDDNGSGDAGMGPAEGSNEGSRDGEEEDDEPSESGCSEVKPGTTSSERTAEPSNSGDVRSAVSEVEPPRELLQLPPLSSAPSPSSLAPRLPQPRRLPHSVPPRLYIQPPAPELGPPHTQRQSSQLRRQSVGRGLQLTPGIGSTQQHFFDDDDRMVPSTPTLVVPHRNDGFAEAIHSPQVAGLSTRFRFGPPEDLLPQASASHSDLGQLASQGGLGMYESPLFLAAHDEDGGGRSVPTTPLQVAAPVTVFTESLPSDGADNMASQSVPMVTASTAMSASADDGDEVFMEHEAESAGLEPSLDSQADMDSAAQQSEDAALPSTSQDPDTSSASQRRALPSQPLFSSLLGRGGRGRGEGRTLISRRGAYSRGGRGSMGRGGFF